jgi:hypothetical protein
MCEVGSNSRSVLANFEHEIKRYHRKRVAGVVQERPDNRKDNHLMDCLRYMALHEPRYVKPPASKPDLGGPLKHFQEKMKRRAERSGGDGVIHLGPGGKFF